MVKSYRYYKKNKKCTKWSH